MISPASKASVNPGENRAFSTSSTDESGAGIDMKNGNDGHGNADDKALAEQPFVSALASLLTIVELVRSQFSAIKKVTSLEAQLSLRCVVFVLVASSCFGVVLVGIWLTVLFATAFSLYTAGLSFWLVGALCLLAQGIMLYLIYRVLLYFVQKIGFSESISAFKTAIDKETTTYAASDDGESKR